MSATTIQLRPAVPTDHSFIFATYLNNRWFSPKNDTMLKKSTWMKAQHHRLERILADQTVVVACLSTDSDTILGYKVQDGSEPFTYVKKDWRAPDLGVVRALEAVEVSAAKLKQGEDDGDQA